jgi:deoxyribodipyrimidine photo-lyase
MADEWSPGEDGAAARLREFLSSGLHHYDEGRNRPDQRYVSRLSPHLHFGELSPNQAWFAVHDSQSSEELTPDADRFLSELGWREFSHNLLFNEPTLPTGNLQRKFDKFPWNDDEKSLRRWQRGQTGYPIVDAGMRELWRTGYMHNRVRMIVGSFLVKNLLLHWLHGARWFWDTLVDADLANNSAGWQWIAGCGADAAPYFRIFNPVTQGKKFDPQGLYVRRFVPELAEMPDKFIHNPWEAPSEVLSVANVALGDNYPEPVVDLKASRERALAAFKSLSSGN